MSGVKSTKVDDLIEEARRDNMEGLKSLGGRDDRLGPFARVLISCIREEHPTRKIPKPLACREIFGISEANDEVYVCYNERKQGWGRVTDDLPGWRSKFYGHEETLVDIATDEDAPDAPFARLVLAMLRDEEIDQADLDKGPVPDGGE